MIYWLFGLIKVSLLKSDMSDFCSQSSSGILFVVCSFVYDDEWWSWTIREGWWWLKFEGVFGNNFKNRWGIRWRSGRWFGQVFGLVFTNQRLQQGLRKLIIWEWTMDRWSSRRCSVRWLVHAFDNQIWISLCDCLVDYWSIVRRSNDLNI